MRRSIESILVLCSVFCPQESHVHGRPRTQLSPAPENRYFSRLDFDFIISEVKRVCSQFLALGMRNSLSLTTFASLHCSPVSCHILHLTMWVVKMSHQTVVTFSQTLSPQTQTPNYTHYPTNYHPIPQPQLQSDKGGH